jgi:uncharacterized membrane protein
MAMDIPTGKIHAHPMNMLSMFGRSLYGTAIVAYGAVLLIFANSITEPAPSWPQWIPGTPFPEYVAGAILIMGGAGIVFRVRPRASALLLGVMFLLWITVRSIPLIIEAPPFPKDPIGNACEAFAVCGGAFLVAGSLASGARDSKESETAAYKLLPMAIPFGRILLAIPMIYFGYAHVRFAQGVGNLVPTWMPWHLFWAYFCGLALVSAGLGILFKVKVRLAATSVGVMILLFCVLLNGPLAFKAVRNVDLWTSLFHTFAWSGAAFSLAGIRSGSVD